MADCLAELTTIGNATAQSCGQDQYPGLPKGPAKHPGHSLSAKIIKLQINTVCQIKKTIKNLKILKHFFLKY